MNEQHKRRPFYHALDVAEFKDQCRELIAYVAERGGRVIVWCEDEPVAELVRYVQPPLRGYGSLKGKVEILGDIEGPMPVEWYTDPAVQTDDDWDISGPMPASWFIAPDDVRRLGRQVPELIDVSILHRHKLLTLDTDEFAAQLEEIITAVSESTDGKVIIFDDEMPLVQITPHESTSHAGDIVHAGEESSR